MSDTLRCALEAKRVRDLRDIEIHQIRTGHSHNGQVPCDHRCMIARTPARLLVDREMARAANFPHCNPW